MTTEMPAIQKNPTYERWRIQIFIITWLSYVGFYFTRKAFSVAKIPLSKFEGITDVQLGNIDTANQVAYAIGQFLCGMAGDKLGTRKVVLLGMGFSILFSVLMGMSTSTLLLGFFFFMQGLCQSSGWAPLNKNMSEFFSRRERGVVMGWWCTNYAVGGLIASMFAGYIAEQFVDDNGNGIEYIFYAPAAVLFVIWVLFILLQRNKPQDLGLPAIEEYHHEEVPVIDEEDSPEEEEEGKWDTIAEVIKSPMILILSAVYFLLKPARYAILFWGPKFVFDQLENLGEETSKVAADSGQVIAEGAVLEAATISSMFELAGPLSVLAAGYLSDKAFRSRRMPVCILGLFSLAICLYVLATIPASPWSYTITLFLIGLFLFGPDALISGTAAIDFGTRKGASTAAGVINGCGSIGAIIGVAAPVYIKEEYDWAGVFIFLAAMVLLAAFILLPQWNRVPASSHSKPETDPPSSETT